MDDSVENARRKLEESKLTGEEIVVAKTPNSEYFPLQVNRQPGPRAGIVKLEAKVVVGRSMWFYTMKQLLTLTLKRLQDHKWSILRPAEDMTWLTSDDPVLRLNYHSNTKYDFKGGWDSTGTEILLPLSPQHLLYTQVGQCPPRRGSVFTREQTTILRRLITEHAHRQIFTSFQDKEIPEFRPRVVNARLVEDEKEQWRKWDREQNEAEQTLFSKNSL